VDAILILALCEECGNSGPFSNVFGLGFIRHVQHVHFLHAEYGAHLRQAFALGSPMAAEAMAIPVSEQRGWMKMSSMCLDMSRLPFIFTFRPLNSG
jgi:hypothetical protein